MEERDRSAASGTSAEPALRPAREPVRGRHLATRDRRQGGGWAVIATGLVVLVGVVLVARMLGAAEPRPQPAPTATTLDVLGPPPTPPAGPAAFGNLVRNWSFEQDLSGWGVVGAATAGREPQGRTSGSSAAVRATGPQPSRVGLALAKVVPSARRGSRYVASAWVRSTPPGLEVTVRLVALGGGSWQASKAVATTLPGDRWRKVSVAHTVAAAHAALDLQITAAGVGPGEALLVDEVEVRAG